MSNISGPDFNGKYMIAIHVWFNGNPHRGFGLIDEAIASGFTIKSTEPIKENGFVVLLEKQWAHQESPSLEHNPDRISIGHGGRHIATERNEKQPVSLVEEGTPKKKVELTPCFECGLLYSHEKGCSKKRGQE
jgi:hypothetical protein